MENIPDYEVDPLIVKLGIIRADYKGKALLESIVNAGGNRDIELVNGYTVGKVIDLLQLTIGWYEHVGTRLCYTLRDVDSFYCYNLVSGPAYTYAYAFEDLSTINAKDYVYKLVLVNNKEVLVDGVYPTPLENLLFVTPKRTRAGLSGVEIERLYKSYLMMRNGVYFSTDDLDVQPNVYEDVPLVPVDYNDLVNPALNIPVLELTPQPSPFIQNSVLNDDDDDNVVTTDLNNNRADSTATMLYTAQQIHNMIRSAFYRSTNVPMDQVYINVLINPILPIASITSMNFGCNADQFTFQRTFPQIPLINVQGPNMASMVPEMDHRTLISNTGYDLVNMLFTSADSSNFGYQSVMLAALSTRIRNGKLLWASNESVLAAGYKPMVLTANFRNFIDGWYSYYVWLGSDDSHLPHMYRALLRYAFNDEGNPFAIIVPDGIGSDVFQNYKFDLASMIGVIQRVLLSPDSESILVLRTLIVFIIPRLLSIVGIFVSELDGKTGVSFKITSSSNNYTRMILCALCSLMNVS